MESKFESRLQVAPHHGSKEIYLFLWCKDSCGNYEVRDFPGKHSQVCLIQSSNTSGVLSLHSHVEWICPTKKDNRTTRGDGQKEELEEVVGVEGKSRETFTRSFIPEVAVAMET